MYRFSVLKGENSRDGEVIERLMMISYRLTILTCTLLKRLGIISTLFVCVPGLMYFPLMLVVDWAIARAKPLPRIVV